MESFEERAFGQIPSSVLNALIPGYAVFESIGTVVGVNISTLAFCFVLVAGLRIAFDNVVEPCWRMLTLLTCSTVTIDEGEDVYYTVLDWFQKLASTQSLRKAELTSGGEPFDEDLGDDDQDTINNRERAWQIPLGYLPRSIFTVHKKHLFRISRQEIPNSGMLRPSRRLLITVFSLSIAPVKSLLEEVRNKDLSTQQDRSEDRIYNYRAVLENKNDPFWRPNRPLPIRHISTVYLDPELMEWLLRDINRFFDRRTKSWYQQVGRHYHRGYLFHGPPGCGKTTFILALAGLIKLKVYTLQLNDKDLTETGLMALMNGVRGRSIILLEDIDSAGAVEPESQSRSPKESNISFSSILNMMDGLNCPEGCLFILTTNHPKKLPPSLIRPGRVDSSIEFGLATTQQIRALFIRMYSPQTDPSPRPKKLSDIFPVTDSPSDDSTRLLAERFAQAVPDEAHSIASLQDYLMLYKDAPSQAVEGIFDWLAKNPCATKDSQQPMIGSGTPGPPS